MNEKPLKLEKTTYSVLSVLLLIYALNILINDPYILATYYRLSYSKNEVWPKFAKIAKIKELENSEAYLEEGGL